MNAHEILCRYFAEDVHINKCTGKIADVRDVRNDKYSRSNCNHVPITEQKRLVTIKSFCLYGILYTIAATLVLIQPYAMYRAYIDYTSMTVSIWGSVGALGYAVLVLCALFYAWDYISNYTITECNRNDKEEKK